MVYASLPSHYYCALPKPSHDNDRRKSALTERDQLADEDKRKCFHCLIDSLNSIVESSSRDRSPGIDAPADKRRKNSSPQRRSAE
ncbi:hypothetical protein DIRU0_E17766 [Diutina rugosa]